MKIAGSCFAFLVVAASAVAQPTMSVSVDLTPGDLGDPLDSGVVTIPQGANFDVVVTVAGIPQDFFTYEFSITPLEVAQPGLLKTGEVLYQGNFDAGDVPGEYIIGIGGCDAVTDAELLRVSYSATVAPTAKTLVALSGTDPSSYGGEPGLAACDGTLYPAVLAPGGSDDCGDPYPAGSVMLNGCVPGPIEEASFGQVKARF